MSVLPFGRLLVAPGASLYDWLMSGHVLASMLILLLLTIATWDVTVKP